MDKKHQKYFLGANSCEGFVSEFTTNYSAEDGWKTYIIKGGPGCGKSSFMKHIVTHADEKGLETVLCPCSSDPHSLDAIILPQKKIIVMDGTPPHVVEPSFPGVCEEIVNLGVFWDSKKLDINNQEIIETTLENKRYHRKASLYLSALGQVLKASYKISNDYIDNARINSYTQKICKKFFNTKSNNVGKEWVRFISGITPLGIVSYTTTINDFYNQKIIISDKHSAVSTAIFSKIKDAALQSGYEIITLKNALLPNLIIDGILIPEISLCFVSENSYQNFGGSDRRIHERRFMNVSQFHKHTQKLLLNKHLTKELLSGACESIAKAKEIHDKLEKYYIAAMDFKKLTLFAEEFVDTIL